MWTKWYLDAHCTHLLLVEWFTFNDLLVTVFLLLARKIFVIFFCCVFAHWKIEIIVSFQHQKHFGFKLMIGGPFAGRSVNSRYKPSSARLIRQHIQIHTHTRTRTFNLFWISQAVYIFTLCSELQRITRTRRHFADRPAKRWKRSFLHSTVHHFIYLLRNCNLWPE